MGVNGRRTRNGGWRQERAIQANHQAESRRRVSKSAREDANSIGFGTELMRSHGIWGTTAVGFL
jgi:hypothetical protein